MKKTVYWKLQNELLFKEQCSIADLERIGETVIYAKQRLIIENIEHNFDEKCITVILKHEKK